MTPAPTARESSAWEALARVEDPEIPVLNLVDLGVIRFVRTRPDATLEVGLSPTYSGCPATEVIRRSVERALEAAQVGPFSIIGALAPPWSSDWISAEGRRKLAAHGIAPPGQAVLSPRRILHADRPAACPRCNSTNTESVSEFGSTPCKALYRCRECLEPFEYFKCI
jgi:ring-1,2-phenylacetyl-CoA epoxidase subunit PaaD